MSFRFKPNRHLNAPVTPIMENKEFTFVDDDGVSRSSFERCEIENDDNIPSPSDFTLEAQLSSGVPLQQVSSLVLDVPPTSEQVTSVVNSIVDDKK